jgi:hypothetical protein
MPILPLMVNCALDSVLGAACSVVVVDGAVAVWVLIPVVVITVAAGLAVMGLVVACTD